MQYNLSAPSAWQFVAGNGSDAVNSWGQPRAYAIVPTGACGASVRPSRGTVYTPAFQDGTTPPPQCSSASA